jgi:hypothetical protein
MINDPGHGPQTTQPSADLDDLLARLRGPRGRELQARLIDQLAAIERRLGQQAAQLQPSTRMRQLEAARLAVQIASDILRQIRVDPQPSGASDLASLQQLFRGVSHDQ